MGWPSFKLRGGLDGSVHEALYARDVLGLTPPTAVEIPPRLLREVPHRASVLTEAERLTASEQWPSWWNAILAEVHLERRAPDPDLRAWKEAYFARRDARGDGPDYQALADRPELRKGLIAVYAGTEDWLNRLDPWERDRKGPRRFFNRRDRGTYGTFDPELLDDVAAQVAAEREVPLDALRGVTSLVLVDGAWWHLLESGIVLHSPQAAHRHDVAAELVRAAFAAWLPR